MDQDDIPNIKNPVSVFPKPQRMFPEDARPAGGQYLNAQTKEDMTGHKAALASIGVFPGGKPYFKASQESVDETGSPGRGSATTKTNLFKQKAGWKWVQAPEGHEDTSTIVSVEHRGDHHYALNAHFPKGVDLARYENATSEPRLRPTTKGNLTKGSQVGTISVRGKEHPVYDHVIVKADGGAIDYIPHDDPRRERNFQRWFGNSTVVDGEMKPWVHYHITKGNFSTFIPGGFDPQVSGPAIWLTPHKKEQPAGHNVGGRHGQFEEGTNVMPLYVKMEKPLFVDESDPEGKKKLERQFGSKSLAWPMTLHHEDVQKMKDAGYDGIYHMRNDNIAGHFNPETGEGLETIVFHPSQLKSATGNQGTFDPEDPDITKAGGGEVDEDGITAYHGSPHDFEQFDINKIGTGEGAQAYGHGLYFAQDKNVAENYRKMEPKLTSKRNLSDEAYNFLDEYVNAETNPKDWLAYAIKGAKKYRPHLVQEIENLAPEDLSHTSEGKMYEVHIKAHPDHFLDWDAPLSGQSEHVKNALLNSGHDFHQIASDMFDGKPKDLRGADIYHWLSGEHEGGLGSPKNVTDHFSRKGIRGIKYLDAGSRRPTDQPTRNYVVFDHNHVAVKRKYAQGGVVG